jgi:hypothetical protein
VQNHHIASHFSFAKHMDNPSEDKDNSEETESKTISDVNESLGDDEHEDEEEEEEQRWGVFSCCSCSS